MDYFKLRYDFRTKSERARVVDNIERLRAALDEKLPAKDQTGSLLLASWNIRDLGKDFLAALDGDVAKNKMRRGAGPRTRESYYYIAEIISRFDFVAVQEVNDIEEWEIIHDILGRDWDYIATEVTHRGLGGNGERLLFAFDRRKVFFRKIAGEIVLPAKMLISDTSSAAAENQGKQFRRTPFLASFQAGWFRFDICTVHLYYGSDSGSELQERIAEIDTIAEFMAEYAKVSLRKAQTLFLLGDFNIVSPEHATMQALVQHGFRSPGATYFPNNITETKYYDQIAYLDRDEGLGFSGEPTVPEQDFGNFRFFDYVFRTGQAADYVQAMGQSQLTDFREWSTYQMSDHMPLWVRLGVDNSAGYLKSLKDD